MVVACAGADEGETADQEKVDMMDDATRFLSFADLRRPSTPNAWLIAPATAVAGEPDEPAPTFTVPAGAAAQAWLKVVEAQPRTDVIAVSDDGLQIEAGQRSAVFGVVDRISARFIPLDDGRSTVALFSRASIGYWDLGVNRRRLQDWLAELQARLEHARGTGAPR